MLNSIIHGDYLEVMKDIPDHSIDMILCDLPYQVTQNKWDIIIPFEALWEQYKRIIIKSGAIVLTATQPFTSMLIMSNLKMFKYDWTWIKEKGKGCLNAKKQPLRSTESVCVFYLNQPIYNPQYTFSKPYVKKDCNKNSLNKGSFGKINDCFTSVSDGKRYPKTDLYFTSVQRTLHPSEKPVALFEYLIKTYTNENQTVLDNCIGSGTTAIAAINTNRNYIGIEKDENYFNIATERIKNHTKQPEQLSLF